jgi:hypothetical protein
VYSNRCEGRQGRERLGTILAFTLAFKAEVLQGSPTAITHRYHSDRHRQRLLATLQHQRLLQLPRVWPLPSKPQNTNG